MSICLGDSETRHREGRIEDLPGKDEIPQQSKFEQKKRSDDQQHQGRSIARERVCQVISDKQ